MYDFSKRKIKSTCSSCDHSGWNDAAYDCILRHCCNKSVHVKYTKNRANSQIYSW